MIPSVHSRPALIVAASGIAMAAAMASGAAQAEPARAEPAKAKVAYSSPALSNVYTVILSDLIQKAAKDGGLEILPTVDTRSDAAQQITDIATLIDSGVKGILAFPIDGKAIKVGLDRAAAAGVAVVGIDTAPSEGGGKVAITVTTSSVTLAERACEALGNALGGKGKVLEIQGRLDNQAGVDRSAGFQDCIKSRYPEISIVSRPGDWVQEKATVAAGTVLGADPEVNAIYLASDSTYLPGVLTVLKRLDRLKPIGDAGHVPIVAIDGSPFALEQVRAGFVDASISQPVSEYATYGVEYLKQALAGATFAEGATDHGSKIVALPGGNLADVLEPTTVTQKNAAEPGLWGNQQAAH